MSGSGDERPVGHGWFKRWSHAYHEAAFRAAITGRRYRVSYDPANRWWNITELGGAVPASTEGPTHE